jgi:transcriptional regulator with XRE-family HTH domain
MFGNLGRALRFARETKKQSQADLAELAQVSVSQLSKYENGRELPKLQSLQRICKALEIQPYQLLYAMFLMDRSEETVLGRDEPSASLPTAGILDPEVQKAFDTLWSALFGTYDTVVGDRMRSVPPDEVWKNSPRSK